MSSADEIVLTLLLLALFGTLWFLRLRFPNASRHSETGVLILATVLFFSICNFFLGPRGLSGEPRVVIQTKASLLK